MHISEDDALLETLRSYTNSLVSCCVSGLERSMDGSSIVPIPRREPEQVENMSMIINEQGLISKLRHNTQRCHHMQKTSHCSMAVSGEPDMPSLSRIIIADHVRDNIAREAPDSCLVERASSWSEYVHAVSIESLSLEHWQHKGFIGPTLREHRTFTIKLNRMRREQMEQGLCPDWGRYSPVMAVQGPKAGKLVIPPNSNGDPFAIA